jgi:AraC-like DNA-binding protein
VIILLILNFNSALAGKGDASMIQLQRKYRLDSDGTEDAFNAGHVKSYEEYLVLAEIPKVDGVANRIVDALVQRVGQRPLSVDDIAGDVRLTRRTLQRRLQEQSANFAQLRDSVRFHYAIKFLIDDHMSVDSVSKALDFSDRTSFTNAFKRWTGLSPSLFRKLFRDYA